MSEQNSEKAPVKILALACSPSKGFNSDHMLDAFLEGVHQVRGVEAEKIYLNDLKIENYSFANRVPDPVKEPDMVIMAEKIMVSRGMVIATPTFDFGVPAALKNLLDRMSYKALDPKHLNWFGQPTGMLKHIRTFDLVSCGTPWYWEMLLWFLFPACWLKVVFWYFGAKTWGSIYGTGLNATHQAKDDLKLLNHCRYAGEKFAQRLLTLNS